MHTIPESWNVNMYNPYTRVMLQVCSPISMYLMYSVTLDGCRNITSAQLRLRVVSPLNVSQLSHFLYTWRDCDNVTNALLFSWRDRDPDSGHWHEAPLNLFISP